MKIQHALRAFTAKDQKSIKLAAENFPTTSYYDTEKTLTAMGIGEALVTVLSEKGTPTPLALTVLRAPMSRMDILTDAELTEIVGQSKIAKKYNEVINRESAFELLKKKVETAQDVTKEEKNTNNSKGENATEGGGVLDSVGNAINSPIGKVVLREVTRGLLGVLGLGGSSTRKKRSLW